MAGQKLGSSALLCYLRPDAVDPTSSFSLTVANVGTCQAVLCRGGKPLPLSKVFSLEQEPEEAQRVKDQKAIITEVSLTPLNPGPAIVGGSEGLASSLPCNFSLTQINDVRRKSQ